MKNLRLLLTVSWMVLGSAVYAQKTISEATLIYNISIHSKNAGAKVNNALNGATTTIFLKGGLSRTEMSSSLGTETTIYNAKVGNAVILKEYSGQKLMITLSNENWETRNKKFAGIKFEQTSATKVIEGYNCKMATAKLNDGSSISVYFAPDIIPVNKEYNQAFKNLPGLPLEYEFETEKMLFKYHIANIEIGPVAATKFEFPKSGYRIMTYDENKKGKIEE